MSPRGSPRSESEWVTFKYCFSSTWLLSSFPDFSKHSRPFVNVYWFTTYTGIYFVFSLISRSALVCALSCTIPYLSIMMEL